MIALKFVRVSGTFLVGAAAAAAVLFFFLYQKYTFEIRCDAMR